MPTSFPQVGGADAATNAAVSFKAPRERLVTLKIEAEPCPRVFARALRFVSTQSHIPVDTCIDGRGKFYTIEIVIDRDAIPPNGWLLEQIEGLPAVRSAVYVDCLGKVMRPGQREGETTEASSSADGGGRNTC